MHVHQGHLEYEVQVHPVVLDLVVHPVQLGPVVLDCVARDLQAPEVQLDPLVLCHPKELPLLELHLATIALQSVSVGMEPLSRKLG